MIEKFRIILPYIVLNIAQDREVSKHLTIYCVEHRSWSRRFESSYHILCWTSLKIEKFRIMFIIYCVEHRSWPRSFETSYHILCWTSLKIEKFRIILPYIVLNIAHDRDVSNHLIIYCVEHLSRSRSFESSYHILCWTSLMIETFRIIFYHILCWTSLKIETFRIILPYIVLNIAQYRDVSNAKKTHTKTVNCH